MMKKLVGTFKVNKQTGEMMLVIFILILMAIVLGYGFVNHFLPDVKEFLLSLKTFVEVIEGTIKMIVSGEFPTIPVSVAH